MKEDSKLFDFEGKIDLFDQYRFYIKLSHEEMFSPDTSQTEDEGDLGKIDPLEQTKIGTFLHENQHYLNFIGTPVGIYDSMIRVACLTQISILVRAFPRSLDKLKTPFAKNLSEYPVFAGIYNLAEAVSSYFFCPLQNIALHSINNTNNFDLVNYECNQLYTATQKKILKKFPVLVVNTNNDGNKLPRYVPIGLQAILEGFARLNQDLYFKRVMPPDQYAKEYEERLQTEKYTLYYLLQNCATYFLQGLDSKEIETIVLLSFYFSLICIGPINQEPFNRLGYWGRDGSGIDDKVEHFLSNLSHPGYTFFKTLKALKEIAKEDGGVSTNAKDIMKLLNKVCERIGCRPIGYLYQSFSLSLESIIDNFFPIELETYPFAKHYFKVSLELMKQAADNPYDFIYYPWEILNKLKSDYGALIFRGKYVMNYNQEKFDWFIFSDIMRQFFTKKRIFCPEKRIYGTNKHCKNDRECSLDKNYYPYSKCEDYFIDKINGVLGDVNKLVSS
jgi:hypothetical protein